MFYTIEEGHPFPHDPFKAMVSPRPIGWISTRATDGRTNLAPYSFFMAIGSEPPMVMFSSVGWKDSASFAQESGVFACNIVPADLVHSMNVSSAPAPRGTSEFDFANLTMEECNSIDAPRVAEAAGVLECRVTTVFQPKDLDGAETENVVVIGQVVAVHIDEAMVTDGRFDVTKAKNASRLGYMDYSVVEKVFEVRRPNWPLDK